MKKATILVLAIMYSLASMGQQRILSDVVNITLPKNSEKLTKEKLKSTDQPSAHINPRRVPVIDKNGKGDYFKVNGILMQLNAGYANNSKDYLEDTQAVFKEMAGLSGSLPPNYHSQIKNINNFKVLIIYKDESENVGSYSFFSVNNSKTSALNGIMEFNKSQKDKATAILDEMLKSVTFK